MTPRRFNSLPEAKRYIYDCLAATLDADLHAGAAGYIYNEGFSETDVARVEKAAEQVLAELNRKSKPRRP